MAKRVNILGDIRAEHDKVMLQLAFYETPDYRTLIESSDRPIVIGRRGTGKSALCHQLNKYWSLDPKVVVSEIVAEEDQVIGMRPLLAKFGTKYNQIKAGARIAWKYGLLLEVTDKICRNPKINGDRWSGTVLAHLTSWRHSGDTLAAKVKEALRTTIPAGTAPELAIGGLASSLQLTEIQNGVVEMLRASRNSFVFLIDQLDDGFEPDELGVGLVGGFVHAAVVFPFLVCVC